MIAPLNISSKLRQPRRGFTVVELLVVVTVIAILMAILIPTISGMFRTTSEFAMTNQQQQLEGAIEKFKTDYGFYPSDFSEFVDDQGDPLGYTDTLPPPFNVTVEQRLKQFLSKISSTHNEDVDDPIHGPSETRLEHWWEEVGSRIAANSVSSSVRSERLRGPTVALWFWLSQLHNDAQYPFSGFRKGLTSADNDGNGIDDNLEITSKRVVFLDFESLQIVKLPNGNPDYADYATEANGNQYGLYYVIQSGGDGPLAYFHHSTYLDPNDTNDPQASTAIDFAPGAVPPNIVRPVRVNLQLPAMGDPANFYNPTKFQVLASGYDNTFGDVEANFYENSDNICNFGDGRLDIFLDEKANN